MSCVGVDAANSRSPLLRRQLFPQIRPKCAPSFTARTAHTATKRIRRSSARKKPIPVADRTAKDLTGTNKLRGVPYGVLVARGGKHTAIVMYGLVYEAHWESGPKDMYLYGHKDMEKEWDWYSGLIMVPPGFW